MSPNAALVWDREAADEYAKLIERRKDKAGVRQCVEGHLLAVVRNIEIARVWPGPGDFRVHDFQCLDGKTTIYLRAVLQVVSPDLVAVLSCNSHAL